MDCAWIIRREEIPGGPTVCYQIRIFPDSTKPYGFLSDHLAAQACMAYYLDAAQMWVSERQNGGIVYTDQADPEDSHDYKAKFLALASIYGVPPDMMVQAWPEVRLTVQIQHQEALSRGLGTVGALPTLPARLCFSSVPKIGG